MNITWKKTQGQFASGETGHHNNISIFGYHYDATRPKSDTSDNRWQLTTRLPGIVGVIGNYKNEQEAKQRAEEVFSFWLGKMGLVTSETLATVKENKAA